MDEQSLTPSPGDVLLIVCVQNDFFPGGALPVPHGADVVAPLNRCIEAFERRKLPVYSIRDWHPTDHRSFREQGGTWPAHCIAGMHGAEVPAQLRLPPDLHLVLKERRPADRSYSGFQATGLAVELRETGCRRVFIGGLGTEYGIRATALDAFAAGFETIVLEDAIRPLEVQPGDGARALGELRARGVRIESVDSLTSSPVSA